jgi:hypothetical protein
MNQRRRIRSGADEDDARTCGGRLARRTEGLADGE